MTLSGQLAQARGFIIDLDGVLYRGKMPVSGAPEFIEALRLSRTPLVLLTNNSVRTAALYVDKLARMGIHVEADRILTSGQATALYLCHVAPEGATVFLIGEEGVRAQLVKRGFVLRNDPDVDYVVVGFDRAVNYEKLKLATLAIRAGAKFIGTNPDKSFPTEAGLIPGNGAILAAIEAATDVAPLIVGKPQPAIFELALEKLRTEAHETVMIGDRLDTDIVGAHHVGLITILVLSGVTGAEELASASVAPDMVYDDIAAVHSAWRRARQDAVE
jgi:4-nitrophenyl phosphatase